MRKALTLSLLLCLIFIATTVAGGVTIDSWTPAEGSVLIESPQTITITFSGAMQKDTVLESTTFERKNVTLNVSESIESLCTFLQWFGYDDGGSLAKYQSYGCDFDEAGIVSPNLMDINFTSGDTKLMISLTADILKVGVGEPKQPLGIYNYQLIITTIGAKGVDETDLTLKDNQTVYNYTISQPATDVGGDTETTVTVPGVGTVTIPADTLPAGSTVEVLPMPTTGSIPDGALVISGMLIKVTQPGGVASSVASAGTVTLEMKYVKDSLPEGVNENLLRIHQLYQFGDDDLWKLVVGSTVDIGTSTVSADIDVADLDNTFAIVHAVGYGDLNGDGIVSGIDLEEMYLLGLEPTKQLFAGDTALEAYAADVNGDGDIRSVLDIIEMRQYLIYGTPFSVVATGAPMFADKLQPPIQTKPLEPVPQKLALLQNYPNPFNPETWIPYTLNQTTDVEIQIYNANGQLIRTLRFGKQAAGYYVTRDRAAYWDGTNDMSERVTSGLYFYRLIAGKQILVKRMVVLK